MNQDKQVAVYDNTVSARTYLSYISEQAGGFACIGRDGKLYIRTIGENTVELPIKYFQKFSWGDRFKISRVRYEDGVQLFEKGNTANNTIYINQENMYIVDQEQIDNIYSKLNDLEVYSFEGDSIIDPALDIGDILIIDNKKIIYQGSSQYSGKFKTSISSKIQSKLQEETTTRIPTQKVLNRRIQSQIDQAEGKITQLAQETTEKIEQVQEQTNLNTDEIARLGSTETVEGEELTVNASNNPAKLYVYGNTEQEGEPTPDTPIEIRNVGESGSIRLRAENKNKFNLGQKNFTTYGVNVTFKNSSLIFNGTTNNTGYMTSTKSGLENSVVKIGRFKAGNYKVRVLHDISKVTIPSGKSYALYLYEYKDGTYKAVSTWNYSRANNTVFDLTVDEEKDLYFTIYCNSAGFVFNNYEYKIQIEKDVATDYVESQRQDIVFPLSEGQLLHEGDYLAEDGIHNDGNTYIFNGQENLYQTGLNNGILICGLDFNGVKSDLNINTHFPVNSSGYAEKLDTRTANKIYIGISVDRLVSSDVNGLKTYLAEQYANGTPVTVEYKLAEETITPYTPEQQKVLDSIETFKGINHIYCIDEITPERIILEYYPNTPYNDTLVNKDTFDKVTTEMNAEINIKASEVETSVRESTTASILTLLNNNYLSAEQVNALVNGNAEDIATVKEQLKQTVTSSQMQIEITKAIEGGVSYLKNTLFTIDENGMWIATSEDEFNALYNNKGMYLYSYDEMIAKFDINGSTITGNLNLEGEFITPNLRMMNVNVDGVPHTHIHWIGG